MSKKKGFEDLLNDLEEVEVIEEGRGGGRKWDDNGLREFLTTLVEKAGASGKDKVYVPYDMLKTFYHGDRFPTTRKATVKDKVAKVLGIDVSRVHESNKAKIKLKNGKVMTGAIIIDL